MFNYGIANVESLQDVSLKIISDRRVSNFNLLLVYGLAGKRKEQSYKNHALTNLILFLF